MMNVFLLSLIKILVHHYLYKAVLTGYRYNEMFIEIVKYKISIINIGKSVAITKCVHNFYNEIIYTIDGGMGSSVHLSNGLFGFSLSWKLIKNKCLNIYLLQ